MPELVCESSLKAALDRDWDQQIQKDVVQALQQEDAQPAQLSLSIAQQVQEQDVQVDEKESLIKGVAKNRRISVEDGQMRHGRKSRSLLVDGYKCHSSTLRSSEPVSKIIKFLQVGAVNNERKVMRTSLMEAGKGYAFSSGRYYFDQLLSYLGMALCL